MKEKKTSSTIFMILTFSILFAMSLSVANATASIPVSGSIFITAATVTPNPAGESDNAVLHLISTGTYTGSITGSYTGDGRWVGHNVGTPDLWRNTHNVATFSSATVMGKTGTLSIMLIGKTDGGTWVIIGGTGDLAGLHGQGTYSSTGALFGKVADYEGEIHFDP
jgi:hypothetical protein